MAEIDGEFSRRRGHRRYQSMMAQQFSTQLDDVFNMDSGLDTLVHDVESKRQSVFIQQRELEELQERIRAAEAALGTTSDEEGDDDAESDDSESSESAGQTAAEAPRARGTTFSQRQPSIFAIRETKDEEELPKVQPVVVQQKAQAPSAIPPPGEYVMVKRPRPGMRKPRVDSHIEVSSEDEQDDEDDDEEESSEEENDDESSAEE